MRVFDELIPPWRALVRRLVAETGGEGWEVRRAYLASVFTALDAARARYPNLDSKDSLAGIIAGMIELLGEPAIAGGLQAGIYAASAKPEHRQASAAWFDRHPDEYAAIQRELADGIRLN